MKSDYAGLNENEAQTLNVYCFPNPSSNNVAVNFVLRENSDVKIEVADINGRIVYESGLSSFSLGQHAINIQTNQWTSGIYFINLKANENSKMVKFIKQ